MSECRMTHGAGRDDKVLGHIEKNHNAKLVGAKNFLNTMKKGIKNNDSDYKKAIDTLEKEFNNLEWYDDK